MQLPTQQQFVADCLSKYRWEPLPADQKWEAAHFPLPSCSGEHETVKLWSADHTVQGLLQSVELDHPCFYHAANSKDLYNLETYYPEYSELFKQLKSRFNSRQGKIGGKKSAAINKANGTALYDPKIQSAGGKATSAQRWQCLVTDHISNSGGLSTYQRARGIDTSLRVRRLDLEG